MDISIFTYEDTREIRPLLDKWYKVCPRLIEYIHKVCAQFSKNEHYAHLNLQNMRIEMQYLFFAAIDYAHAGKGNVYAYLLQKIEYLFNISLYMPKQEKNEIMPLVHAMVFAYDTYLELNWEISPREMQYITQYTRDVEQCIHILSITLFLKHSYKAYIAQVEKNNRGLSQEIETILEKNNNSRIVMIKKNSIAMEDIYAAAGKVRSEDAQTIKNFLSPLVYNSFGYGKDRYMQELEIEGILEEREDLAKEEKAHPKCKYCSLIRLGTHLGRSDEEIQQRLEDKAKQGATALARYLASSEGKLYFDLAGRSYAEIIRTINQELGTNIEEQAFQRAMTRNGLSFQ